MRVAIVSDAWRPQVNGVVRTLEATAAGLRARGHAVEVIGPEGFRSWPAPTEPALRLALAPGRALAARLDAFAPDALHLATEGPLGWAGRRIARRRGWRFTTSFHTLFPDYLKARLGVPRRWSWAALRRFHAAAGAVLVATPSLEALLGRRGIAHVARWGRGVDLALFRPHASGAFAGLPRPVWLSVGRLAPEKNLPAFLALDLPGSQVVVGEGPDGPALRARFPRAHFLGHRAGAALAACYADCFVFPSRTDTFGLVLLEALACGTPVAAFPVPGPRDVLGAAPVGALDEDLRAACLRALGADRARCRAHAAAHGWDVATDRFLDLLVPLHEKVSA
ncbi:glycosyltransferase family 4 protein [Roseococcus sp. DSY-14]|uniref:glycosyltransferase family 4 protein n=1 Tax=Roseococcus sp. DSY-14 TaxID=3369650 RepID=UPI00387B1384